MPIHRLQQVGKNLVKKKNKTKILRATDGSQLCFSSLEPMDLSDLWPHWMWQIPQFSC